MKKGHRVHPETRKIAAHMQDFGLCLLGRALVDVTFSEMTRPYAHPMGVERCAHAAEIIIKARIAEEHPLLIFTSLPKPKPDSLLDIETLLTDGRTLMYSELPNALWAATGYQIPNLQQFVDFGRTRNAITHLAVPPGDMSGITLHFAFQVIEPMVYDFWETDIISCYEAFDEEEEYLLEAVQDQGITFTRRGKG